MFMCCVQMEEEAERRRRPPVKLEPEEPPQEKPPREHQRRPPARAPEPRARTPQPRTDQEHDQEQDQDEGEEDDYHHHETEDADEPKPHLKPTLRPITAAPSVSSGSGGATPNTPGNESPCGIIIPHENSPEAPPPEEHRPKIGLSLKLGEAQDLYIYIYRQQILLLLYTNPVIVDTIY